MCNAYNLCHRNKAILDIARAMRVAVADLPDSRRGTALPGELLAPYPAEAMTAWRVGDDAKNSRIEPHAGMAEPVGQMGVPSQGELYR